MSDLRLALLNDLKTQGFVFKKTNDSKPVYVFQTNAGDFIIQISLGMTKSSVSIKVHSQNGYFNILKLADYNTGYVSADQIVEKYNTFLQACETFNSVLNGTVVIPSLISDDMAPLDPLVESLKN